MFEFPRSTRPVLAGLLFLVSASYSLPAQNETLLLRSPSISTDHVVFTYASDVWIAGIDGSNPTRLTVSEGVESDPYLSPDGRMVAFTGEYDGNTDVFVVPVSGGMPKRLTYHPESDVVRGWTQDGKVLFISPRSNETMRYNRLYSIDPMGGLPEPLILPRAERGSISPDGERIAYMPISDAIRTWKRYRGGRTTMIDLFDFALHETIRIPRNNSNDTYPCWVGDKVYFLSDRDFTMNLYSYSVTDHSAPVKLTDFSDFDIKTLSSDGNRLVFEQGGRIHLYDPETNETSIIPIQIDPDLPHLRPRWTKVKDMVRTFSISPTGVRGLFEARGEIFTIPAEKGDTRNLTLSSGAHDRFPAWSPNGDKIAWFSDMTGEYDLYIIDQKGETPAQRIDLPDGQFYYDLKWSPDGKLLLFRDAGVSLYYIDPTKPMPVLIDQDSESAGNAMPDWSPDSKYVTYSKTLSNHYRAIFIYDIQKGSTHQVTDGLSDAISPIFSRDGKYLFFAASTNYALNISGLDMSSYERPVRRSLYCVVLSSQEKSPFAPESDEESGDNADDSKKKEDKEKGKDEKSEKQAGITVIDFAGIEGRTLGLKEEPGDYSNLQSIDSGGFLFLQMEDWSKGVIRKYDLEKHEATDFLKGVRGYEVSANGKKLIYADESRGYGIVETKGSPDKNGGKLDLSGLDMYLDPREEWNQMYQEAWRIERDFFYDPGMHGSDWRAVKAKYEPFLQHVGSRDDLNYLFAEMLGELVVGHAYVGGGDSPDLPKVQVGLLGADFSIENGAYRIVRIYANDYGSPSLRTPLAEPGVQVSEGDYLLAINNQPLSGSDNLFKALENTVGKQTILTVNSKPEMKGARQVIVQPMGSERAHRLYHWVEQNRRKVAEATDGRVAYIYLPDTGRRGYNLFNRYFFSQLDKDAAIIDERFNGGGSVADYMIDLMSRPLINYWGFRDSVYTASPYASLPGPKVMIVNESAGSGGDWLPMAFSQRGLGKLVGRRTWGGLVGIGGSPRLVDGGQVTAPRFGIFSLDGEWIVENAGIEPDIEVEQVPSEVIAGGDPQLEKAIEVILKELESYTPPRPNPLPRPTRAAPWTD